MLSPADCPVCQPHLAALQRFLDLPLAHWSLTEALTTARAAVEDVQRAGCGVRPEQLLLPLMLRLQMREDLDALTRSNVGIWVSALSLPVTTR